MDEGFPDGRSPLVAQRDSTNYLCDGLPPAASTVGDVHSLPIWTHTKDPRTPITTGLLSPMSRLPSSSSQRARRLSPTTVVVSEPIWKADGAASPLSGSRPVFNGTTLLGGSLRVGPTPGDNRRVPPASFTTETVNVSTRPNFEDPVLNEEILGEMELGSQIEGMLASAREDLFLADVGDGSDLAPKQQKQLNVDEAVRAALEVVGQERLARAREISDLQAKITSQQEWFAKELSRHTSNSAKALASTENLRLARLEKQVEAMRNQMFQQGEATSHERTQSEAHEISQSTFASLLKAILSGPDLPQYVQALVDDRVRQSHAHSSSISSSKLEAIFSSPEPAQYVRKLVDDRVQQVLDTQLSAELLQNLINAPSTFASMNNLSQYVQTLVDDRVQHVFGAQLGAESSQERFNAPVTLAYVQKAIFSSSCLTQHVKTLVDVRVQRVVDATHELKQELHAVAVRLQEEREMRAASIQALHSRFASETARISAHVEKTNLCLQEVSTEDRLRQTEEFAEIRAILNVVLPIASRVKESNSEYDFLKFVDSNASGECEEGSCRYKESAGDAEDMNTMHEIVREADGNSEMMKRDIENVKDRQTRYQANLQRQLKQVEGVLQQLQNELGLLATDPPKRVR